MSNRLTFVFGLAALVAACNSGTPATDGGGNGNELGPNPHDGACPTTLTAASPQAVTVDPGNTVELIVRLVNCKGPASASVSFQISGSAQGSTLSAATAPTDASGFASVKLTAGTQAASFKVVASYQTLTPIEFGITVNLKPLGTIVVQLSYSGTKKFTEYQALLLSDTPCNTVDAFALPTALRQATPVANVTDQPTFTQVAVGTYTVVATAKIGTELTGFGCIGTIQVYSGQSTNAPVTIYDLPVLYTGTYLLDNQFNLTGALPPSLATTVTILDEATDDHDLTNESNTHGNNQFGLDPAAFLLDFVFRQLCHWECAASETYDTCSETNHPKGDISALYMHNFMSWSPAKARSFGLCSSLDFPLTSGYVYTWLINQLQTQILGVVPSVATNLLQLVGDLSSAFTKLHIKSQLSLVNVGPHSKGTFEHVLQTMVITVHDLSGKAITKEFKLADVGLTNLSYSGGATTSNDKLQIPTHSFQLDYGKLIQYIYLNYLLPALGYTSTGQMFQSWVNCTTVGQWIYDQILAAIGITLVTPAQLKGFCDLGLSAAGTWIDSNIQKVASGQGTKFELTTGTAEAGTPLGAKRLALTLINGAWTGKITEGAFLGPFTGTFTGQRQ